MIAIPISLTGIIFLAKPSFIFGGADYQRYKGFKFKWKYLLYIPTLSDPRSKWSDYWRSMCAISSRMHCNNYEHLTSHWDTHSFYGGDGLQWFGDCNTNEWIYGILRLQFSLSSEIDLTLQPLQCYHFRIKSFILYTVVYLLFLPKPFSFWRYNWKRQLEWLSFIRVKYCLVFSFKSFILVRRQRHCH